MYKVLIVDDEMLVRIGIKSLLNWQELGFEIVGEASNGELAYEKYLALKPDVVITDIKMPKKDGLWLAEQIKADNSRVEIIFLTCFDDFTYAKEAIRLQISDYILKAEMEEKELQDILIQSKKKLDQEYQRNEDRESPRLLARKQQQYLLSLLLSSSRTIDLVKDEFIKVGVRWNSQQYCFIQFDFHGSLKEQLHSRDQIASILSACMELIDHVFRQDEGDCYAKQFGKSITCLIQGKCLTEIKLMQAMEYLRESMKQYFGINFKSAATPITTTIEAIREYQEWLFKVSDYLFWQDEGTHLTKREYSGEQGSKFSYSDQLIREVCLGLAGDGQLGLDSFIKVLEPQMRRSSSSSFEIKLETTHFINDVMKHMDMYLQEENNFATFQKQLMDAEGGRSFIAVLKAWYEKLAKEIAREQQEGSDILIKKSIRYLEAYYDQKITLESLAGYVGLSKYYFSVLFKRSQTINFSTYLTQLRIEKAKELLRKPRARISEIYAQVGFNDPQYFSKIFKKYTQMTISEYRNKMITTAD